jgi:hypothetical protein
MAKLEGKTMEFAIEQGLRALDVLESSEVMQEFEDALFIRVDRDLWEAFAGRETPYSEELCRNGKPIADCNCC